MSNESPLAEFNIKGNLVEVYPSDFSFTDFPPLSQDILAGCIFKRFETNKNYPIEALMWFIRSSLLSSEPISKLCEIQLGLRIHARNSVIARVLTDGIDDLLLKLPLPSTISQVIEHSDKGYYSVIRLDKTGGNLVIGCVVDNNVNAHGFTVKSIHGFKEKAVQSRPEMSRALGLSLGDHLDRGL